MTQIAPCPVCGEQPRWRGSQTDYRGGLFRLQCLGETHLVQSYGPSEDKAIAAWNTRTPPAVEPDEGLVEKPARLKYYPDYITDPDGLERMRQDVRENGGHTMAHINYNSLGRLIDTIENLRFKLATLTPSIRAQALEEALRKIVDECEGAAPNGEPVGIASKCRNIALRALKGGQGV